MDKKGIQLAISTLIFIILGVIVLIAITLALTGGFNRFKGSTNPYLDTAEASAVKQACTIACQQSDKLTFCCSENQVQEEKIKCTDSRLEVSCPAIACEPDFCSQ